jgi:hypothetical protein
MALLKRLLFWVVTSLLLLFGGAAILFFSIDKTIRIEPETIKEVARCKTLPEVESFLGGPPGDYSTVPYSFDRPNSEDPPEKKESRDKWMRSFAEEGRTRKMWITDTGCIMISLTDDARVIAYGYIRVWPSREPNLVNKIQRRFRLKYVAE